MSFQIRLSSLDTSQLNIIKKKCTIKGQKDAFSKRIPTYILYKIDKQKKTLSIPFLLWDMVFGKVFPISKESIDSSRVEINVHGTLLTPDADPSGKKRDQVGVINDASAQLDRYHSTLISAPPGYGKTFMGIYLMFKYQLPVLLVCDRVVIRDQWIAAITKMTKGRATIKTIKGKEPIDPTVHVHLIGSQKLARINRDDLLFIGMVMIDEIHMATQTILVNAMHKVRPVYLVGLSATPDRADGFHCVYPLFFPSPFVCRSESKTLHVYHYRSHVKPKLSFTNIAGQHKLNWAAVSASIEESPQRHRVTVELVRAHYENEKIIVLVHRVFHARALYALIKEEITDSVGLFIGKMTHDKTKRITICGMSKGGVGMDDPELTMLILASSRKEVRQFIGRIRENNGTIYDIVDDHGVFENQFRARKETYDELEFPIVYCK